MSFYFSFWLIFPFGGVGGLGDGRILVFTKFFKDDFDKDTFDSFFFVFTRSPYMLIDLCLIK